MSPGSRIYRLAAPNPVGACARVALKHDRVNVEQRVRSGEKNGEPVEPQAKTVSDGQQRPAVAHQLEVEPHQRRDPDDGDHKNDFHLPADPRPMFAHGRNSTAGRGQQSRRPADQPTGGRRGPSSSREVVWCTPGRGTSVHYASSTISLNNEACPVFAMTTST